MKEQNAVITSARLTKSEKGILSMWLMLDYGGSAQGFGGYVLYIPQDYKFHNIHGFAGHWIWRCLEIAGVEDFSELTGRTVRVRLDKSYGKIIAIGHIIKDDWFDPSKELEE